MKFTALDIDGAVALVTGGARGIGLSIAERLVKKGATVVIADLDGEAAAKAAVDLGRGACGRQLDVGDAAAYETLVDEIESHIGPLDIVVNNAGIMPVGPLQAESPGVAAATMRVNFWAHYYSYRIVAPRMVARGRGHFINVTSAAGVIHSPGLATYVASKHAATGFARSAREELVGTGVTISAVLPTAVRTELVDGIPFKWWERVGIIPPGLVARRAVGTLKRRPALAGAPFGTVVGLRLYPLIPEFLWLLGRKLAGADRTLEPYDTAARDKYDSRIARQAELAEQESA